MLVIEAGGDVGWAACLSYVRGRSRESCRCLSLSSLSFELRIIRLLLSENFLADGRGRCELRSIILRLSFAGQDAS